MTNAQSKTFNVFTNTEAIQTLGDTRVLKMLGYRTGETGVLIFSIGNMHSYEKKFNMSKYQLITDNLGSYLHIIHHRPKYICYFE